MRSVATCSPSFHTGSTTVAAILLALALLTPAWPVAAANGCGRILVESSDGRAVISSYIVSEPDYVTRMHRQIEQNGEDGTWSVAAGELAQAGYSVSYTCLP